MIPNALISAADAPCADSRFFSAKLACTTMGIPQMVEPSSVSALARPARSPISM